MQIFRHLRTGASYVCLGVGDLIRHFQVLYLLYLIIYFTGIYKAVGLTQEFVEALTRPSASSESPLKGTFPIFFLLGLMATVVHQWFMYRSFHDLEHNPRWDNSKWVGTVPEVILRCFGVLMLLGISGETIHLFPSVYARVVPWLASTFDSRTLTFTGEASPWMMILHCVGLFGVWLLWSGVASCRGHYTDVKFYFLSDLVAGIHWASISILFSNPSGPYVLALGVVLVCSAIAYWVMLGVRLRKQWQVLREKYSEIGIATQGPAQDAGKLKSQWGKEFLALSFVALMAIFVVMKEVGNRLHLGQKDGTSGNGEELKSPIRRGAPH